MTKIITAVGFEEDIIQVKLLNVTKHPRYIAKIFEIIGNNGVNIDMISQVMLEQSVQIEFTVDTSDQHKLNNAIEEIKHQNETIEIYQNKMVSKIFVHGRKMETETGVAAGVFKILGENQVPFYQVTTSSTSISFVIDKEKRVQALEAIKKAYDI